MKDQKKKEEKTAKRIKQALDLTDQLVAKLRKLGPNGEYEGSITHALEIDKSLTATLASLTT